MLSLLILSLAPQAKLHSVSETTLLVTYPYGNLRFENMTPAISEAFALLGNSGATEDALATLVQQSGGVIALSTFYYHLQQLIERGLVCYSVFYKDEPFVTLTPLSASFRLHNPNILPNQMFQLSRFAYCRREGQELYLESPLSQAVIILHGDRGMWILAQLAKPIPMSHLLRPEYGLPDLTVRLFFVLLIAGGFLICGDGSAAESTDISLRQWEFHDLLFHTRSRLGRHRNSYGETYRFEGEIAPLPAISSQPSCEITALYKPDINALIKKDIPFSRVLEERCSTRTFGDEPITDKQLGEFLYRTARIRRLIEDDHQQLSNRPYPNGGALYELEIYLTINSCAGIPSGLYHYCPLQHELACISLLGSHGRSLLKQASAAAQTTEPQVLIVISARFQRVSWKYESMAYALILKNVGALYQTMYLVATAMGLASCALGGGDSDLFSRTACTQYFVESSVGEFLVGSKPNNSNLTHSKVG